MRAKQRSRWQRVEDIATLGIAILLITVVALLAILRWPHVAPRLEKLTQQGVIDRAAVAFVELKSPLHQRHQLAAAK